MNKAFFTTIAVLLTTAGVSGAENIFTSGSWSATAYPKSIPLAFDGRMDTRWQSYTREDATATLTCQLPETLQIQALTLVGANLAGGEAEVSGDGKNWKKLGDMKSTCGHGMLSLYLPEPVSVKGIRLKLRGAADKKQAISISEMAGFIPDVPVNLATFCSIDEKGQGMNWRFSPKFLVDGNSMPRGNHYSAYRGSVLTVDLGENKEVSAVGFCCMAPFDKVVVSTSPDGKNWIKAGEQVKLASEQMLEFPKQTARYLKIEVQGSYRSAPSELIVK